MGARSRRQSGQGFHHREQVDARFQRREDRAQDCAQGGPERPITLKDVRVPEANRLQGGNSFRDTARALRMPRYMVGWASTGIQVGALEAAVKYAQERLQFGKPIASFQMIQDLLAKMLANLTACQCLMLRLAQLDDEGKLDDHHAALAKAFCTAKSRETVSWGREVLAGNGIVADYNLARFFAAADALYSYEGTYPTHNLIPGKATTGRGAFLSHP